MEWFLKVIRQYADFNGRARRKEYWMFFLFNIIFSIVVSMIDGFLGTFILGIFYALALFIPGLAVAVRRLHDTGKSGWWLFIGFVPLIGFIWLLVLMMTEGDQGDNEYGPDPKEEYFM